MTPRLNVAALAVVVAGALVGCGSSTSSVGTDVTPEPTTVPVSSTTPTAYGSIVNTWVGPPVALAELPLGTSHVSTSGPAVGGLYVCDAGRANGAGAFRAGPWIDEAAGTWDSTAKVAVQGDVGWPDAEYSETTTATGRLITSNGLPTSTRTGTFPIASNDPAYTYDRNPNGIGEQAVRVTLPLTPTEAPSPGCMPKGEVAIYRNGVVGFAPVDERNRDAVAYETLDVCQGHPQQGDEYHYHDVPRCILDAAAGASTVVGWAYDGYPIVVERDGAGNLPTNADLDECHGRTSPVLIDDQVVTTYHYSATSEFPYVMGCFHGVRSTAR